MSPSHEHAPHGNDDPINSDGLRQQDGASAHGSEDERQLLGASPSAARAPPPVSPEASVRDADADASAASEDNDATGDMSCLGPGSFHASGSLSLLDHFLTRRSSGRCACMQGGCVLCRGARSDGAAAIARSTADGTLSTGKLRC